MVKIKDFTDKLTLKLSYMELEATILVLTHILQHPRMSNSGTLRDGMALANIEELTIKLETKRIKMPEKVSIKLTKAQAYAYYLGLCNFSFDGYHGAVVGKHFMNLGSVIKGK